MKYTIATILLLTLTVTSLGARTLGFTNEFPDARLRGSAYSLSDSDYETARSQGAVIIRKKLEIDEYVRTSREDIDKQIDTFNRLRSENAERMDRLYYFLRSRGTRVK
jgi:hypothetical protein